MVNELQISDFFIEFFVFFCYDTIIIIVGVSYMKLGFIGTGVMGAAMAGHLLGAGNEIYVYNRTKSKADSLVSKGAIWCDDVASVAKQADLIFTIIGMPSDVEQVYLSDDGIIQNAKSGSVIVDMTTSSPQLAIKLANEATKRDIFVLDAPVTGGDVGAKNGTLTIFVGGNEDAFNKILPYFEIMGSHITYLGEAGSGQHGKMVNQIAISGAAIGMVEALTYARAANLNLEKIQAAVSTGSAASWQMSNMAPRIMAGNFDPGFFIKHFIKDMKIAVDEGKANGVTLPGLELVLSQYEKLADYGHENLGTQGLYKLYE